MKKKFKNRKKKLLGYNLKSARFFDKRTGLYVTEKFARRVPGKHLQEFEEQENFLEELFLRFESYFDDIEELRKFGLDIPHPRRITKEDVLKNQRYKRIHSQFVIEPQNLVDWDDDLQGRYDEFMGAELEYLKGLSYETAMRRIKKRFSKISSNRFLYNTNRDLKRKSQHIQVFLFVQSKKRGIFVMNLRLGTYKPLSVSEWRYRWTHEFKSKKGKKLMPLLQTITKLILPEIQDTYINSEGKHQTDDIKLIDVLGWYFPK